MRNLWITCLFALPAWAEPPPVPSGQAVEFYERLVERDDYIGLIWRYRYVAPEIARGTGRVGLDAALGDIEALCAGHILPEIQTAEAAPDQIVITLMDRAVPYGQAVPEATQYIEAYRPQRGTCVWDGF